METVSWLRLPSIETIYQHGSGISESDRMEPGGGWLSWLSLAPRVPPAGYLHPRLSMGPRIHLVVFYNEVLKRVSKKWRR